MGSGFRDAMTVILPVSIDCGRRIVERKTFCKHDFDPVSGYSCLPSRTCLASRTMPYSVIIVLRRGLAAILGPDLVVLTTQSGGALQEPFWRNPPSRKSSIWRPGGWSIGISVSAVVNT